MKSSLLLLGLIGVLAVGAPASGQYIYMDVNGDGVCTFADVVTSATTAADVYLDTNHNGAGSLVQCADGTNPLDMASFDLIVRSSGTGSVSFDSFTPGTAISGAGFTLLNALTVAGHDASVGYNGPSYLAPGLYKLGTLNVTAAGNPSLSFVGTSSNPSLPSFGTGFGSHCSGTDNPNTITLGIDFFDNCGPALIDDVQTTTWGKIKQVYQ